MKSDQGRRGTPGHTHPRLVAAPAYARAIGDITVLVQPHLNILRCRILNL